MSDIVARELSYIVNGCLFDVHNEVGPGLREECYQKAVEVRLAQAGLPFVPKPQSRRELFYFGIPAAVFEPDVLVAGTIVVELKAHFEGLPMAFFRQTINYLKHWRYELGLLVNFADACADIRRIVFHETPATRIENYTAIPEDLPQNVRDRLGEVRDAIIDVLDQFGLGYSDAIYRSLIAIGIRKRGMTCDSEVIAKPVFREHPLPSSQITPLLIDNSILVQVHAIQDMIPARAVRTMQTHLSCTSAAIGVIVSFGKSRFEIRGVRRKTERVTLG